MRRRAGYVPPSRASEALGYTVVDHATVVATHLGEIIRTHAHRAADSALLQHVRRLLQAYAQADRESGPEFALPEDVLEVIRNLLKEDISVGDLCTIIESLIEVAPATKDSEQLTEIIRQRLSLDPEELRRVGAVLEI